MFQEEKDSNHRIEIKANNQIVNEIMKTYILTL